MSFWGELKRRNVYKVSVAYAIVAWLLIQAASIIFPHLNLPSWATTFVIVIFIIGFPLALLLAWAYEVTPDGIKRTKQVPLAESITHLTGQKLNYIVTGLLVLAVAFILFDNYYLDRRAIETEKVPVVADIEEIPKTIAVLPFVDLSPEKDQEYFVDGLSEELLNCLSKLPDLHVISRTSSFTFKDSDKTIQEIADILGVAHILEGSVRKAGNDLRITAQLIRAADDRHLWSETYNRVLKDIFVVQEDIATAVADELKVTLGIGKVFKQLGGTDNTKAYELYLVAKGQYNKYNVKLALESLDSAIELDSDFALAWASKSIVHTALTITGPANRAAAEQNAAIHGAQKAVELEPDMAAGYYALGYAKSISGDFIGARLAYSNALELTGEPLSFILPVVPIHYIVAGYFEKANELLEEMLITDPLNYASRGWYLWSIIFLGDTQRALEESEHIRVLYEGQQVDFWIPYVHLWTGNIVTRDEIDSYDTGWGSPDLIYKAALEHLDSPKEAIENLRRIYADKKNLSAANLLFIAWWSAYFGDLEFAMEAMEEAIRMNPENIYALYFPLMKEIRQLPRFKEYIREIGLVDYWNEFGWPDICHKLDNGDFECD